MHAAVAHRPAAGEEQAQPDGGGEQHLGRGGQDERVGGKDGIGHARHSRSLTSH